FRVSRNEIIHTIIPQKKPHFNMKQGNFFFFVKLRCYAVLGRFSVIKAKLFHAGLGNFCVNFHKEM
ncbi:MAG: hypothetical protein K2K34_08065, partial [Oscillospiraceae bacterium]|nr:hypothetical protein [Oscillospiraceae bacterium]